MQSCSREKYSCWSQAAPQARFTLTLKESKSAAFVLYQVHKHLVNSNLHLLTYFWLNFIFTVLLEVYEYMRKSGEIRFKRKGQTKRRTKGKGIFARDSTIKRGQ
jgi:hypothetical protein